MSRARDLADLIGGGFTEADIPNLSASKITSGTFADARIAASNVSQHATSFDDNKIVNDISTLGLRVHTQENLNASNTNSASFDVFQDSSRVGNFIQSERNALEFIGSSTIAYSADAYETGNRQSQYSVAHANLGTINGHPQNGLDGSTSTNNNNSWHFNSSNGIGSSTYITFDLGSGNSKIYTGAKTIQDRNAGVGNWKWQGSNDGNNYTDLSSTFTWGNVGSPYVTEVTWSNNTAYRYLKVVGVSGNLSSSPWQTEFEFRTKTETSNFYSTGSFEGNAITAASTSKMGAVITYQDHAGTNALNTDIVLKLSADNGSNYSTATLTALPDFATGIKMAKVNDLSVTAGTQLKYKIEFANQATGSKEARIRGISLQY